MPWVGDADKQILSRWPRAEQGVRSKAVHYLPPIDMKLTNIIPCHHLNYNIIKCPDFRCRRFARGDADGTVTDARPSGQERFVVEAGRPIGGDGGNLAFR
jgi:hypothetical protein